MVQAGFDRIPMVVTLAILGIENQFENVLSAKWRLTAPSSGFLNWLHSATASGSNAGQNPARCLDLSDLPIGG
jgi:hypothetical protein